MRSNQLSILERLKLIGGILLRGANPKGETISLNTAFPPMGYGAISTTQAYNNLMAKLGGTETVDKYKIDTLWNVFMAVPAVSSCVDTLCRTILEKGWRITNPEKRTDTAPKELRDYFESPHPILTIEELLYNAFAETFIYGWTVQEIIWKGGSPVSLNELVNERMLPLVTKAGRYDNPDEAWKMHSSVTGKLDINFKQEEILFFRMMQKEKNSFFPLSPIEKIARSAASEVHAQNHNISFFERGGRIGFAVILPMETDKDRRIDYIKEIQENYIGSENAFRPIVIFGGREETDIQDLASSFTDMDFVNLRQFAEHEIAMAYGIPPEKLGVIEKGTLGGKGSGDSQHRTFHQSTVTPHKRHFGRMITQQIIRAGFGVENYRFQFIEEELKEQKVWFDMGMLGWNDGLLTEKEAAEAITYMEWPDSLVDNATDEVKENPVDFMRPPDQDDEKKKKEDQKDKKDVEEGNARYIQLNRIWEPPEPLDRPLSRAEMMIDWPLIVRRMDEGKVFMDTLVDIFALQKKNMLDRAVRLIENNDYGGIKQFRLQGVTQIRDKNRVFVRRLMQEAKNDVQREIKRIGSPASGNSPEDELMLFIEAYTDGRTDWFFEEYADLVKVHMMEMIRGGVGIDEAIFALDRLSVDFYTVRSERFYRTLSTQVYNDSRVDTFQKIGHEAIPVYELSAILDGRTSVPCRLLDGLKFKAGDARIYRITPANHFNCRSLIVPVVRVIYEDDPGAFVTVDQNPADLKKYEQAINEMTIGFGGNKK